MSNPHVELGSHTIKQSVPPTEDTCLDILKKHWLFTLWGLLLIGIAAQFIFKVLPNIKQENKCEDADGWECFAGQVSTNSSLLLTDSCKDTCDELQEDFSVMIALLATLAFFSFLKFAFNKVEQENQKSRVPPKTSAEHKYMEWRSSKQRLSILERIEEGIEEGSEEDEEEKKVNEPNAFAGNSGIERSETSNPIHELAVGALTSSYSSQFTHLRDSKSMKPEMLYQQN